MFEGLVSNNIMKEQLARAVTDGRPMHAYLFCGAKGSGKMTAARLLAKELVGKNADKAERGSHPDIFVLEPAQDKKLISVEQVRNMRADVFVKPTEALRKIYIINGMELMNDAGQNSLLTILEQPPEHAVFILLSQSKEKVLPTVISRCAVFEMEYVDETEGAQYLAKELPHVDKSRLRTAMRAAQGNIALAKEFVSSETFAKSENACAIIMRAAANKNIYRIVSILARPDKAAMLDFLPILTMYIRDILMYRTTGDESKLVFKDSVLKNISEFDKISTNRLYESAIECQKTIDRLTSNVNLSILASALSIQLGGK